MLGSTKLTPLTLAPRVGPTSFSGLFNGTANRVNEYASFLGGCCRARGPVQLAHVAHARWARALCAGWHAFTNVAGAAAS